MTYPLDIPTAREVGTACETYATIADVSGALRKLAWELPTGPNGEGDEYVHTLEACAEDLELCLAKARGEA